MIQAFIFNPFLLTVNMFQTGLFSFLTTYFNNQDDDALIRNKTYVHSQKCCDLFGFLYAPTYGAFSMKPSESSVLGDDCIGTVSEERETRSRQTMLLTLRK
jgi:hypothetical protein